MAKNGILTIGSLRGGLNNSDDPSSIADDQVSFANNVEFFQSQLGERRLGCEGVDLAGSGLEFVTVIVHIGVHHPEQTDLINNELWVLGADIGDDVAIARRSGGVWTVVTSPSVLNSGSTVVGKMDSVSIHGKFFLMARSDENRPHVWDGTSFRRVGLSAPASAPSAVATGVAGTFADVRYYRVRFERHDADGNIKLRSEPSDEYTFTPDGTKTGATVTRPTVVDGNETHWVLEASTGDGNWWIIATTVVATTTVTDTNNPATNYGDFDLSATVGDYTIPQSAKFVVADQDRLVFGGAWEDPKLGSRVSWTPTTGATGVGNDERVPLRIDSFVDLDWMSGGDLTGLSNPVNGAFYAFKLNRIYKLQRSGQLSDAYTAFQLSTTRGAIEGSIVNGTDEYGGACAYFLDPAIGPCRVGSAGIQEMQGIRATWQTVNITASPVSSHGIYYPDKQQVHWWVAVDGSTETNQKIICQVNEVRSTLQGSTERGWTLADGDIATAWCSAVVPELVAGDDILRLSFRPYIGGDNPDGLKRCDVGSTDNGTAYVAKIVTKAYMTAGLLGKFGIMSGGLLAGAVDDTTMRVNVKLIRDFGKETYSINKDFVPELVETMVNLKMDELDLSQAFAIQVEISDAS